MLLLLLVLSLISLALSLIMNTKLKRAALGAQFGILTLIQGGSLGATVGILLVLLIKGRTLG
ncbi:MULTISPECIES: hypothetical protein [Enterococcus]|uniref:hypothetical protein n=1 Tax=Enterococcus TaxID=1350 RepID=UPI0008B3DF8B|nr:hypothetical protein [Enterococcus malodoratus]BBM19544.1 hypothetical protein G15_3224 [Enterococcus avium]SET68432.1 hypothetical protein SAMN04487821_11828 [Enterococcus malodoratus]HCM87872.1 hypothetical protein [Enterococcus sp.]